jgi:hypothetical protein
VKRYSDGDEMNDRNLRIGQMEKGRGQHSNALGWGSLIIISLCFFQLQSTT